MNADTLMTRLESPEVSEILLLSIYAWADQTFIHMNVAIALSFCIF